MGRRSSCTIYVGNLPGDIRMKEVEDLFRKVAFSPMFSYWELLLTDFIIAYAPFLQYGPIVDIDLKIPPRPPGYAFVEVWKI